MLQLVQDDERCCTRIDACWPLVWRCSLSCPLLAAIVFALETIEGVARQHSLSESILIDKTFPRLLLANRSDQFNENLSSAWTQILSLHHITKACLCLVCCCDVELGYVLHHSCVVCFPVVKFLSTLPHCWWVLIFHRLFTYFICLFAELTRLGVKWSLLCCVRVLNEHWGLCSAC